MAARISDQRRRLALLLVPVIVAAVTSTLVWLADRTLAQPFAVRAAISITALTLAGGMMGLPLPLGMSRFNGRDRSWYWAINGATSVLGSVVALAVALIAGFTVVLWCAVAAYAIAAVVAPVRRVA